MTITISPPSYVRAFRLSPLSGRENNMAAATVHLPVPQHRHRSRVPRLWRFPLIFPPGLCWGLSASSSAPGSSRLPPACCRLGMADLKGHVGISYDQGAWLGSAFDAALMFIGPFIVYVGGLLGPRRVLLFTAAVFTVTCAFLPLIHSYSLLLAALITRRPDLRYFLSAHPDFCASH